jgi:hypothetical protein
MVGLILAALLMGTATVARASDSTSGDYHGGAQMDRYPARYLVSGKDLRPAARSALPDGAPMVTDPTPMATQVGGPHTAVPVREPARSLIPRRPTTPPATSGTIGRSTDSAIDPASRPKVRSAPPVRAPAAPSIDGFQVGSMGRGRRFSASARVLTIKTRLVGRAEIAC